jgi:hypothetical protein
MSYCFSLQTHQVVNVLKDEHDRMKRFPKGGEVYLAAQKLYQDARETLISRGYSVAEINELIKEG